MKQTEGLLFCITKIEVEPKLTIRYPGNKTEQNENNYREFKLLLWIFYTTSANTRQLCLMRTAL